MGRKQREALVDHELCHCYVDIVNGDYFPKLEEHDLTEFKGVVRRHGFWMSDIREFVQVAIESDEDIQTNLFNQQKQSHLKAVK